MSFNLSDQKDTIIALATPQGVGAIAVIRLSGVDAIRLTNDVFFGKNLEKQANSAYSIDALRFAAQHIRLP